MPVASLQPAGTLRRLARHKDAGHTTCRRSSGGSRPVEARAPRARSSRTPCTACCDDVHVLGQRDRIMYRLERLLDRGGDFSALRPTPSQRLSPRLGCRKSGLPPPHTSRRPAARSSQVGEVPRASAIFHEGGQVRLSLVGKRLRIHSRPVGNEGVSLAFSRL